MIETAIIGATAGAISAIVAVVSFAMTRRSSRDAMLERLTKIEGKVSAAENRAEGAEAMAGKALAQVDVMQRDVNDYRVEMTRQITVVKTLVETQVVGLRDAEQRLARAIDDMGERFDRMANRLDRVIEGKNVD